MIDVFVAFSINAAKHCRIWGVCSRRFWIDFFQGFDVVQRAVHIRAYGLRALLPIWIGYRVAGQLFPLAIRLYQPDLYFFIILNSIWLQGSFG